MLVAALSRLARSSGDKEGGPLPFVAVALLLVTAGVAALALKPTWGVLAGAFFTHLVVTYVVIDLFVRMLGIDSTEPSSTADRRSPSGEASAAHPARVRRIGGSSRSPRERAALDAR